MKALKNTIFPVLAVMIVVSSVSLFAQEKSELNKKLSELKGKVEKVTVKVDGKDVVFEGKDAENMVKKMKGAGIAAFSYSTAGKNLKTRAYTVRGKELAEIREDEDGDEDVVLVEGKPIEGVAATNIMIQKNDGKTKVVLTEKDKDGKPVEKILEGDEAEKYLKENNEGIKVITMDRASVPVRVKGFKTKAPRTFIVKSDKDDEDDDAEAVTVYVTKGDKGSKGAKGEKGAKEVTLKVIKEKKIDNKED
jgi:hypothetical protein